MYLLYATLNCAVDDDYMDFRAGSIFDVEELKQGSKLNKSFPTLRTQFVKKQLITATPPCASRAVKGKTSLHSYQI